MKGISVWCVTATLCWHACVSHTHAHHSAHTYTLALHVYEHWPAYILIHIHLYLPRFLSPTNQRVTDSLIDTVYNDANGGYSVKDIKRAAHRYYESRRRLGIEDLPDRQEKAAEQRKKRKYRARQQRAYDRYYRVWGYHICRSYKVPLQWRHPKDLEMFCSTVGPLLAPVIIFRPHLLRICDPLSENPAHRAFYENQDKTGNWYTNM